MHTVEGSGEDEVIVGGEGEEAFVEVALVDEPAGFVEDEERKDDHCTVVREVGGKFGGEVAGRSRESSRCRCGPEVITLESGQNDLSASESPQQTDRDLEESSDVAVVNSLCKQSSRDQPFVCSFLHSSICTCKLYLCFRFLLPQIQSPRQTKL